MVLQNVWKWSKGNKRVSVYVHIYTHGSFLVERNAYNICVNEFVSLLNAYMQENVLLLIKVLLCCFSGILSCSVGFLCLSLTLFLEHHIIGL